MANTRIRQKRNLDDFMVGMFLIAVAIFGLILSWHLRPGSASAMGPGYVPRIVLFLQIALGLGIVVHGLTSDSEEQERWALRPLFWILVSIAFFAGTLEPFGLIVATIGLIALASLAHRDSRPVEIAATMAVLTVFCSSVFVYLLGLTIPVLPAAWVY